MRPFRVLGFLTSVVVLCVSASAAIVGSARQHGVNKASARAEEKTTYKVPLNNTGIADVRFLNPRSPFQLNQAEFATNEKPRETLTAGLRGLEFQNRTADRKFKVTMEVELPDLVPTSDTSAVRAGTYSISTLTETATPDAERKAISDGLQGLYGAHITCKAAETSRYKCTAIATLERTRLEGSAEFTRQLFLDDLSGEVLTFTVRRFRENDDLSNSTGYVRKWPAVQGKGFPKVAERDDKTSLVPVASVGLNSDRRLGVNEVDGERVEVIDDDLHPFLGQRRTHSPATARVDVKHNLGNRAKADLSFRFKREDLGDQDESSAVQARKYKLSVFALNQTTLHFGKYDFLTPASEVGISLRGGQGFSVSRPLDVGQVRLSYIAERESDPVAEKDKGDRADYLLEWNEINLPFASDLHANLFALYGADDDPGDRHDYRSYGAEIFFGRPLGERTALGATAAVIRSNRSRGSGATSEPADDTPRGRGTVFYGRATFSLDVDDKRDADEATVGHTVGVTLAGANGDNPGSDLNEGYIGETQAFEPDQIFFASLAAPLAAPAGSPFSPGIGNKLYLAADYNTERWSLLELLAAAVGVDETDIVSKSTTVSVHHYRSRRAIDGHKPLGMEYGVQFEIETPSAVTVSLGAAYFVPSSALEPFVRKNAWSFSTGVKIEP